MIPIIRKNKTNTTTPKIDVPDDEDLSDITLYTLNSYFEGPTIFNRVTGHHEVRPIIGNENIRVMATLAWFVKKMFVLLEGESGSAKSEIQSAIIVLLFGDEGLDGDNSNLYFIDTGSDMVQFRREVEIKQTTHAFIPELQNAINYFDMLKKWAEGRTFKRDVLKGENVKAFRVPPRPVITCLALNNDKVKDLPSEVVRRFLHLFTTVSKDINTQVHKRKGLIRALPDHELPCIDEQKREKLRRKLVRASLEKRRVINPYAPVIQEFIPKNFTVSNSYVDFFFDIIEAVTMFYSGERFGTNEYIFSTIQDNYQALEICGDIFVNMSLGIQDVGKEILERMEKPMYSAGSLVIDIEDEDLQPVNGYYSVNDVMTLLKTDMGIYRDKKTTEDILRKLTDAGYLGVRTPKRGKVVFYYKLEEFDENKAPTVNWDDWDKFAHDWMKKHYSKYYDKWKKTQSYSYEDVFTGEKAEIKVSRKDKTI